MKILSLIIFLLYSHLYSQEIINFTIEYFGFDVALVTFTNKKQEDENIITITAKSTPFISRFAYHFDNTYISYSDSLYRSYLFEKKIDQKYIQEKSQVHYDRANLSADFYNKVNDFAKEFAIKEDTRDLFAMLYYLRSRDIKEKITFTIDAASKIWVITSEHVATETVRTKLGRLSCNKIEISFKPYDQGERFRSDILTNNIVNENNTLIFWFTDDERQLPVKAQYNMRPFNVNWSITAYENK